MRYYEGRGDATANLQSLLSTTTRGEMRQRGETEATTRQHEHDGEVRQKQTNAMRTAVAGDAMRTAVAGDAMVKAAVNTSKRDSERGGEQLQTQELR